MIKEMTMDDYEALFDLWRSVPNMGLRSLDDSAEGIERFLRRNPGMSFVAYEGAPAGREAADSGARECPAAKNRLTGAILCGHDGRRGYIYHTVVLPGCRRQGIATALLERAVGALQKEGITRVCLNVVESNEVGKAFWIGKGWEKKNFLGFYSKAITDRENLPLFQL